MVRVKRRGGGGGFQRYKLQRYIGGEVSPSQCLNLWIGQPAGTSSAQSITSQPSPSVQMKSTTSL